MLPLRPASQAEPIAPPNETYSYSHDAAVAAITSYYELIARLQWDETSLEYPSPGGWPQITRESFASLGVTDAVIDLLRHIPYIMDDAIEILENTHARCFIDSFLCEMIHANSEKQRRESRDRMEYGFKVYLDTTYGLIILTMNGGNFPSCEPGFKGDMVNPYIDSDAEEAREQPKLENPWNTDDEEEEEDIFGDNDWRRIGKSETFRIETFFDLCKEQWRRMNLMPRLEYSGGLAMLLHPTPCSDEAMRQQILQNAGWPGSGPEIGMGWDKKRAKQDMIEYLGAWDLEESD
ncbi:hypothetical protein CKAH01_12759 [Colletotrichum kahawae]|uniref:Uncharacterized protein n=1 Tax=Colletotrichum kahawae TaxID=34407 RepID=A0AAD9YT86_COLKA|nr:hypothetical protein CKAH01_12759 [Colletotrichum kahawae]